MTLAALAWAVGLLIAGMLAPAYSTSATSSGQTTASLVDENGSAVLIVLALPAVVTVIVGMALARFRASGSRRSHTTAVVLVTLLMIFCVLGALTIGLFVLPVALLLGGATKLSHAQLA